MLGQGLERSASQCGQHLGGARTLAAQIYGAVAIAPPFRFKEVGDLLFVETRPDQASRHAADDRIGWYVFRNHGTAADHRPVAHGDARHDDHIVADPDIVADRRQRIGREGIGPRYRVRSETRHVVQSRPNRTTPPDRAEPSDPNVS